MSQHRYTTQIRIPVYLGERIKSRAAQKDRSMNYVITHVLEKEFGKYEETVNAERGANDE